MIYKRTIFVRFCKSAHDFKKKAFCTNRAKSCGNRAGFISCFSTYYIMYARLHDLFLFLYIGYFYRIKKNKKYIYYMSPGK